MRPPSWASMPGSLLLAGMAAVGFYMDSLARIQSTTTAVIREPCVLDAPKLAKAPDNTTQPPQPIPPPTEDVWWIEDTEDEGWFDGVYKKEIRVRDLQHLERRQHKNQGRHGSLKTHFHPLCGRYRFDESQLPTVSVVITTSSEQPNWMTISVHSVLARTPPQLLKQVVLVNDKEEEDELSPELRDEFETLQKLDKVTIIHNSQREGCARSRLIGARVATGDVLVFLDSHVEMMSARWYHHLAVPIVENPHTMAVQTIETIHDTGKAQDYHINGDPAHGVFDHRLTFRWLQKGFDSGATNHTGNRVSETTAELPSTRVPYATPMGPGALFGIRRDYFEQLGGYDEGLYVWGSENVELALKVWMCGGGRVVVVPCSRAGHVFRASANSNLNAHWPPRISAQLQHKTGVLMEGSSKKWTSKSHFARIKERNNIRVVELWIDDHPARDAYYRKRFGVSRDDLPPEWAQYVKEMETDPQALRQRRLKQDNRCHDFAWFDRHVLQKLVGQHHPWYEYLPSKGRLLS